MKLISWNVNGLRAAVTKGFMESFNELTMQLSKSILSSIAAKENLLVPGNHLLQLPEKILQFGTGVLLRGLPDHLVHIANKQGCFNGRVVVVKSTTNGDTDAFERLRRVDGMHGA